MRKVVLLFIIVALTSTLCSAQIELAPTVFSSSGGYGENESFSISWTLGEIAVTTFQSENMILTQGFQQPLDIGTDIKKNEINWNISAYPNPVENELHIRFDLKDSNDFLFEIQDASGRILLQESHSNVNPGDLVIVNTSNFIGGVYFLRILTTDFQQVKVTSISKL